jgi:hypothetical protein
MIYIENQWTYKSWWRWWDQWASLIQFNEEDYDEHGDDEIEEEKEKDNSD